MCALACALYFCAGCRSTSQGTDEPTPYNADEEISLAEARRRVGMADFLGKVITRLVNGHSVSEERNGLPGDPWPGTWSH